jgi:D-amino-acid dehydrogenase
MRPGLNPDLLTWAWRFWRAATPEHVRRSAPLLRDLSLASRAAFEQLGAEIPDFGLTRRGLLMLCKGEHTLHEEAEVAKTARTLGLQAEVLSPSEVQALDPTLEMKVAGGVYFPQDCHLDPARLMAGLAAKLAELGVEIRYNAPVTGWQSRQGRIEGVVTPAEELSADEYVVAGGTWSGDLLKQLDLCLPLQAGKGYSVTVPQPPQLPELCSILIEARVAVTPMVGTLRFAGTMELGKADLSINPRRVKGMLGSIGAYFPAYQPEQFKALPVWSGLRPCSPDGLPYIGRTRRYGNLSVAAGHAMMGVSLAPVTGDLIASDLSGEPSPLLTPALSPDRYQR